MRVIATTFLCLGCLALVAAKSLPDHHDGHPAADSMEFTARSADSIEGPTIQIENQEGYRQFAVAIPQLQQTHYQSSDDSGRYRFAYANPEQIRMETRDEDGTVSGSYFYTDAAGEEKQAIYMADETGFHVKSNIFPTNTPEVAAANARHLALWNAIAEHHRVLAEEAEKEEVKIKTPVEVEQDPTLIQTKPIDVDLTIDDEKEAIITDRLSDNTGVFEQDAEPIKLLAQLYAKHLKNADQDPPPPKIERPEGFYPSDLRQPYAAFDLFRRFEDIDDSVVVTNPEFVDLRAFVLLNAVARAADFENADELAEDSVTEPKEESVVPGDADKSTVESVAKPVDEPVVKESAAAESALSEVVAPEKASRVMLTEEVAEVPAQQPIAILEDQREEEALTEDQKEDDDEDKELGEVIKTSADDQETDDESQTAQLPMIFVHLKHPESLEQPEQVKKTIIVAAAPKRPLEQLIAEEIYSMLFSPERRDPTMYPPSNLFYSPYMSYYQRKPVFDVNRFYPGYGYKSDYVSSALPYRQGNQNTPQFDSGLYYTGYGYMPYYAPSSLYYGYGY